MQTILDGVPRSGLAQKALRPRMDLTRTQRHVRLKEYPNHGRLNSPSPLRKRFFRAEPGLADHKNPSQSSDFAKLKEYLGVRKCSV